MHANELKWAWKMNYSFLFTVTMKWTKSLQRTLATRNITVTIEEKTAKRKNTSRHINIKHSPRQMSVFIGGIYFIRKLSFIVHACVCVCLATQFVLSTHFLKRGNYTDKDTSTIINPKCNNSKNAVCVCVMLDAWWLMGWKPHSNFLANSLAYHASLQTHVQ